MSDLIYRQALCEYALNQKDKSVTPNDMMRFPSAPPQRKKGRWSKPFNMGTYKYQCSECEKLSRAMYDFCPNCGARMEGESE